MNTLTNKSSSIAAIALFLAVSCVLFILINAALLPFFPEVPYKYCVNIFALTVSLSFFIYLSKNLASRYQECKQTVEQVAIIIQNSCMSFEEVKSHNDSIGWDVSNLKGYKLSDKYLKEAYEKGSEYRDRYTNFRLWKVNIALILYTIFLLLVFGAWSDFSNKQDIFYGIILLIIPFLILLYFRIKIREEQKAV